MNVLHTLLAVYRWEAVVLASLKPLWQLPHRFEPRKYGSKLACGCGARREDPIHIDRPPRPPQPQRPPRSGDG
jgi:hypothetical protein